MNISGISLDNWSKLLPVSKQAISKQIGHKLKAYIQKHIYYQIYPSSSGFRKEQVRRNLNRLLERLKTLNLQPKGRGRKPFLNLDLLRSFTGAKGNSPIEILKDFICKIRNITTTTSCGIMIAYPIFSGTRYRFSGSHSTTFRHGTRYDNCV